MSQIIRFSFLHSQMQIDKGKGGRAPEIQQRTEQQQATERPCEWILVHLHPQSCRKDHILYLE